MNQITLASPLSADLFLPVLKSYPDTRKYWLAYSGGMDSSVLLHLFFSVKDKITPSIEVVYIDHGLTEKSRAWGSFCKDQCQYYGLKFSQIQIKEDCPKSKSIEEWAREKRYQLFAEKIAEQDILFTAHHQDDQIETFFLQALRGSGPRGLACMPAIKKLSHGFHARPLLQLPRSKLQQYAREHGLKWQTDPSNQEVRYDRNYLRHKVLSNIEVRWPAYRNTITRLISHQKEYKQLLNEFASNDMRQALSSDTMVLKLDVVQAFSIERQKNLLVIWLAILRLQPPRAKHLNKIISELISIDTEKSPCVNWGDVEIRRYKNQLYAAKALKADDVNAKYDWSFERVLEISGETLRALPTIGKGISKSGTENTKIVVCYRQGGEKIYPVHLPYSKTVKQLFQEQGVLPWYRDQIPLIYIDGRLAVIPGFCADQKFAAKKNEESWQIVWSGYDKVIQSELI